MPAVCNASPPISGSAKKPSCSTACPSGGSYKRHSRLAKTRSAARISVPSRANGTPASSTPIRLTSPIRIIFAISSSRVVLTNGCANSDDTQMDPKIAGFDWDEANRDKCQQHGLSIAEIEAAFRKPIAVIPDPRHSHSEERFKAIGIADEDRHV